MNHADADSSSDLWKVIEDQQRQIDALNAQVTLRARTGRSRWRRAPIRFALITALLCAAVLGSGAVAMASIPDSGGVIHGCIIRGVQFLRIIDSAAQQCRAYETPISWNQSSSASGPRVYEGTYTYPPGYTCTTANANTRIQQDWYTEPGCVIAQVPMPVEPATINQLWRLGSGSWNIGNLCAVPLWQNGALQEVQEAGCNGQTTAPSPVSVRFWAQATG